MTELVDRAVAAFAEAAAAGDFPQAERWARLALLLTSFAPEPAGGAAR